MSHQDSHQLNRQTPVPGKPGGQPGPSARRPGGQPRHRPGGNAAQVPTSGKCPAPTPTRPTGRLQYQVTGGQPRRLGLLGARRHAGLDVTPRHPPAQPADSSSRRPAASPARRPGSPRWPAPAAWSSRRPAARRPRCHTATPTSSTGRLPFQANPVASPAPAARLYWY